MGIYQRKDSPFYWMHIEASGQRTSTGIPVAGGSPAQDRELKRQALERYTVAQSKAVLASETPARAVVRFSDWADWYDTHVITHHRSAVQERSMLGRLGQFFGRYTLDQIDATLVEEWKTTRARQVTRGTVNRELDELKAMVRAAVPKHLAVYPLGDVRRLRVPESEPRVLSHEEEARLLEVGTPEDRAFVIMALDTLLRLGSLIGLKWPQVKLDRRVILPLNAKVSTDAKPITGRLYEALTALDKTVPYVFGGFHVGAERTSAKNRAIRRFAQLCALANVPHGRLVNGVTIHSLRHTGATRALQNGASLRTVMKLGGWRDTKSVIRYLHAADSDVIAAAESIGRSRE
jgi:integrase